MLCPLGKRGDGISARMPWAGHRRAAIRRIERGGMSNGAEVNVVAARSATVGGCLSDGRGRTWGAEELMRALVCPHCTLGAPIIITLFNGFTPLMLI